MDEFIRNGVQAPVGFSEHPGWALGGLGAVSGVFRIEVFSWVFGMCVRCLGCCLLSLPGIRFLFSIGVASLFFQGVAQVLRSFFAPQTLSSGARGIKGREGLGFGVGRV